MRVPSRGGRPPGLHGYRQRRAVRSRWAACRLGNWFRVAVPRSARASRCSDRDGRGTHPSRMLRRERRPGGCRGTSRRLATQPAGAPPDWRRRCRRRARRAGCLGVVWPDTASVARVALGEVLEPRSSGVLPLVPRAGQRIGPVGMARETYPGWRVSRRRWAASLQARDFTAKSTSAVLTVPAVRPGARWNCQYRFVWSMTLPGGGAPNGVRSSVVCASSTSVAS
jgi:hypothetical protein